MTSVAVGANVVRLLPANARLTVVLADGQPVVRSGLRALVEGDGGVWVVGECRSGREAVREALLHRPDVLLMDLEPDGVAPIREVRRAAPDVAVLVFTRCADRELLLAAMRAGARGIIDKAAEEDDILRAIRGVAAGAAIFGPGIAGRLAELFGAHAPDQHPFPALTTREREVLDLIAGGLRNSAIARRLSLSPKTVSNHISTIFAKLNVPDRAAAIIHAREAGLGRLP